MKKLAIILLILTLLTGCNIIGSRAASPHPTATTDYSVNYSKDNSGDMAVEELDRFAGSAAPAATKKLDILPQTPLPPPKETVKTIAIHFINVGHGDCILIKAGQQSMLIDTGFTRFSTEVVGYLKKNGVHRLEYVIITHPHADHIGGLSEIIKNFEIQNLIMPNISYNDPSYTAAMDAIQQKRLTVTEPKAGMRFYLANAIITLLAPNNSKYIDINNYSIVSRLTFENTSFLFTGDASSKSEAEMIANESVLPLRSNLIKMGHHGGTSSSTQAFLNLVNPEYAIISCANNEPGNFPSPVILARLAAMGVKTFRTDQIGTIIVNSNGKKIEIK